MNLRAFNALLALLIAQPRIMRRLKKTLLALLIALLQFLSNSLQFLSSLERITPGLSRKISNFVTNPVGFHFASTAAVEITTAVSNVMDVMADEFVQSTRLSQVWSKPVGAHDRRRPDRADAQGAARDEQLRESKRP